MEDRYVKTHRSRDIKKSILFVSRKIIDTFGRNGEKKLNELFESVENRIQVKEKDFMFALNFLFVLGVVSYDKGRDIVKIHK